MACRARPSARSAISRAACTLPRTASRTCASAIRSAHVRHSGSLGTGSSSLFLYASESVLLFGLPEGLPLWPFFQRCGFPSSPMFGLLLFVIGVFKLIPALASCSSPRAVQEQPAQKLAQFPLQ